VSFFIYDLLEVDVLDDGFILLNGWCQGQPTSASSWAEISYYFEKIEYVDFIKKKYFFLHDINGFL